jgi:sialate O-acetylesterase
MVLQRNTPVAIWGTAVPGVSVQVKFAGKFARATADATGAWSLKLGPFAASADPRDLEVQVESAASASKITLHNILVGEVWICSGQSNMEYAMGSNNEPSIAPDQPFSVQPDAMRRPPSMAVDLAAANDPGLRLFKRLKALRDESRQGGWRTTSPETLSDFSAIAYYFGEQLRKELKVPIGLVETSWGGSRIELWTPASAYAALPDFAADVAADPAQLDGSKVGTYWKSMVQPIIPYTAKGFLWYQGESNVMPPSGAARYEKKMEALIASWRSAWGNNAMPFYYVQIPPLYYSKRPEYAEHPPDAFAELREQQTLAMTIPHTGMAVIVDTIDNVNDIHPKDKTDPADRLARWALAKDYGRKDVVYTGPIYRSMRVEDGAAILTFDHAEGLKTRDGAAPSTFTIAGSDGKFVPATAQIRGTTVVVSSAEVPVPSAVRFAWGEFDQPNLTNGAGLPPTPFRTDGPPLPAGI